MRWSGYLLDRFHAALSVAGRKDMRMYLAQVSFLGPEKGGRLTRPQSGYHPQVDAGGAFTSCVIEGLGGETTFEFDTAYRVSLRLLFPELYHDTFSVGSTVRFYEGSHLVGTGTILAVH
jgi:hypothetical protein